MKGRVAESRPSLVHLKCVKSVKKLSEKPEILIPRAGTLVAEGGVMSEK